MGTVTIKETEAGEVIETTNGVTTTTFAVMKGARRAYPNFDPKNGVNVELLRAVVEQITLHKEWWDQGVWRRVVETGEGSHASSTEQDDTLLDVIAYADLEPTCGTAMCFAGWAADLTPTNWVVDAAFIKAAVKDESLDYEVERLSSLAMVPITEPGARDTFRWTSYIEGRVDDMLRARGFSPETHMLMEARDVALMRLGIGNDPLSLFDGENSFESVLIRARAYEKYTVPVTVASWEHEQAALVEASAELLAEDLITKYDVEGDPPVPEYEDDEDEDYGDDDEQD